MHMKKMIFCLAMLKCTTVATADTQVVALRGYWKAPGQSGNAEGSAQNSLASYKKADAINVYGSEIDVWMSTDGVVYVNHDRVFKGCEIQKSTSKECNKVVLDNGEKMPKLKNYLKTVKKGNCRLVIEIKTHKDKSQQAKCVSEVLSLVKKAKLEERVDYIAFSAAACEQLVKEAPKGTPVYYLNGDKSPEEVKAMGLTGVDYHQDVFMKKHPEWLQQFKDMGLKINIWTVDSPEVMKYYINKGVEFITTNEPELLISLLKK